MPNTGWYKSVIIFNLIIGKNIWEDIEIAELLIVWLNYSVECASGVAACHGGWILWGLCIGVNAELAKLEWTMEMFYLTRMIHLLNSTWKLPVLGKMLKNSQ